MFGRLKDVSTSTAVAIKPINTVDTAGMPKLNDAHDRAMEIRIKRIEKEVACFKKEVTLRTKGAIARGKLGACTEMHRHGYLPESSNQVVGWLQKQGYVATVGSLSGCECRAHLFWGWENKVTKTQTGNHDLIHGSLCD